MGAGPWGGPLYPPGGGGPRGKGTTFVGGGKRPFG